MAVEIIGRSIRAPSASNVDSFFKLLREERCVVTTVPEERWGHARFWHPVPGIPGKAYTFASGIVDNINDFDPAVFGLTVREAMFMDPQQRMLLQLVWRALEDASISLPMLQKERVGVYVGASSLDTGNTFVEDPAAGGPYFMTGNTLSIISNRISHVFGLNGPSLTIDTACSSSLVALDQAVRALQSGEIDTAIVGGVNILAHPFSFIGFSQARMLSPEGVCRAYGEDGQGYVRSEGGGVVVLRATENSTLNNDRSYATIVATGLNSAGRTNGISLPSREMQAELLSNIYSEHQLDPNDLAFIEGHGTGTKVGDPAELWAIGTELGRKRRDRLLVGSVKSNVGHSEPASGMFGLIKAMLSLQHNFLPASLHAEQLNSDIDFEDLHVDVNRAGHEIPRDEKRRLAGINSFGFGGTNAHIVISDPAKSVNEGLSANGPFMVSAHTESALRTLLKSYVEELQSSRTDLDQLVAASAVNRTHHKYRFSVDSAAPESIRRCIEEHLAGSKSGLGHTGEAPAGDTNTAFVFAGNGSQWAGMAMDAYRHDTLFAQRITEICSAFKPWLDVDLLTLLTGDTLKDEIADTRVGQALLFAIQASLSDLLLKRNIKPSHVFGHSVGEIAAAYCAGILSLEHAIAIVAVRSRHQHALAGEGQMAAVAVSAGKAMEVAEDNSLLGIELAAVNTASSVTISGPVEEIRAYKEFARKLQIPVHILDINYPFHHSLIDRERDAFFVELPPYETKSGNIAFISSVTGKVLGGNDLDALYWWNNVRDIVRFNEATATAISEGCNLFVEISPRSILSAYLAENSRQNGSVIAVVPTLTRPARDDNPLPHIVAAVVANGVSPWLTDAESARNASVVLPPLPFENETLRVPETSDGVNLFGRGQNAEKYTLLGWRTDPKSFSWKNHIDANLFPDIAEHVVDGKSILPGSAFIEIAVTAARQLYGVPDVELMNLEIIRPLELQTSRLSELSTIVSPETGQIEIRSREYLSEDDWSVHAVARIRKIVKSMTARVAFVSDTDATAAKIDTDEAYETARQFGLDYGPSFSLLNGVRISSSQQTLSVQLSPPAKPAHPYLSYNLNPISVDAAFHGLVALFSKLTGDAAGAPYIPVRFGSVRYRAAAGDIRSAQIDIQKFSPHSLKIRVELFDADGELIAILDDCRFKRTFLKLHHSLETISYHFENVTSRPSGSGTRILPDVLCPYESAELGEETLLQDASVYRASYDIAAKVLESFGGLDHPLLAPRHDLRSYFANCFIVLEDYGLARFEAGRWQIAPDSGLPSFGEIIREVVAQFPASSATAILVNDNYHFALTALESLAFEGEAARLPTHQSSEATLDHFRNGLEIARKRVDETCHLTEAYLATASQSGAIVVELGATSVAVSTKLAALAELYHARLLIFEDDENLRSTLKTAFARNPHVSVIDTEEIELPSNIDLAVSASGHIFSRLHDSDDLREAFKKIAATGAELLVVDHQYGVLADFLFGLQPGWFEQAASSDFPIGKILSSDGMLKLVTQLGFSDASVVPADFAQGSLSVLIAQGHEGSKQEVEHPLRSLVTIGWNDAGLLNTGVADHVRVNIASLSDSTKIEEAVRNSPVGTVDIIYTVDKVSPSDHSQSLQNHVNLLGLIAEALRQSFGNDAGSKPRLFIIAPGGTSSTGAEVDAVSHGVWAFARVLQNEYDEISVVSVDIDNTLLSEGTLRQITDLQVEGENELRFDCENGAFQFLRAVPGPFRRADNFTSDYDAASITQKSPGRIETIIWQQNALKSPAANEVLVEIAATGLNFRDVMWAMGMLPEEALEDGFAGATIGMEFSGTIRSVGDNVQHLHMGDRVMGIGPDAFSTHVVVSEEGVTRIPENMGLVEAATLPVTFLTAYYALMDLGRLRAGETVLIHGGAGGVGLAALQIAKLTGATVIATAGTDEKRNLLTTLGADHVFDSRSLEFFNDVMNVTDGAGVDVVINSLFQEAMERSIELVKPFGRFLELGKRDYYADSKIGLRPFRKNISYFGIDADQLLVAAPDTTKRIFDEIARIFADNQLKPLPYRTFEYDEISSAFRLMQSSGHIGKIIVTPPKKGKDGVLTLSRGALKFSSGVYLVVGGIGGFGLEAANWLAEKGASHIALATRSGVMDVETKNAIEQWQRIGVSTSVHACDVTNEHQLASLLEDLRQIGPMKGILHAAMVLDDALITNLTPERNRPVIHTKVEGAALLDKLTDGDDLDLFVLFSSATTMIGNPGQSNYVAANGYLEGLACARRQRGKPALAVAFGAIADTGFLARNADVNELLSKRIGKTAMKARDALRFVEEYLSSVFPVINGGAVVIADIDWSAAAGLPIVKKPFFSKIGSNPLVQQGASGEQMDLYAMIDGKSVEETDEILHSLIAAELSSILQMAETNISREKVLRDIGLDSLMAMELGTSFEQKTGIELPLNAISDGTTVGDVVVKLREKLHNRQSLDGAQGNVDELLSGLTMKHIGSTTLADVA
ncbi:SDR family NAD(P)-dependent oxidoreductase [Agrobacterium rosae]|uniref:type I polyketide synthase n=1 Tax=Agrobacterium rosae TaxID=1972867 RepID=UPI0019D3ECD2|nr:type I polyketide synthase [Agrobacterium rosae]MBN7809050.1 SDR family NAD(P)-dependent oxidoreductase [Agrobacterium rosae]